MALKHGTHQLLDCDGPLDEAILGINLQIGRDPRVRHIVLVGLVLGDKIAQRVLIPLIGRPVLR